MPKKPEDLAARFWKHVAKTDGCWNWTGAKNRHGYGAFNIGRHSRVWLAHRFSALMGGLPVVAGSVVMHTCDNPACVNPAHLRVGTQAENTEDMIAKGRARKARGEAAGKSKFTPAQVREIRELAQSLSNGEIGRRYGVDPSSVWKIVTRRSWAHV